MKYPSITILTYFVAIALAVGLATSHFRLRDQHAETLAQLKELQSNREFTEAEGNQAVRKELEERDTLLADRLHKLEEKVSAMAALGKAHSEAITLNAEQHNHLVGSCNRQAKNVADLIDHVNKLAKTLPVQRGSALPLGN